MNPQTEGYPQIMSLNMALERGVDNELVNWYQSAPP